MIQDAKLGTHKIGSYLCMLSVSVRSCLAFVWKLRSKKNLLFFRKSQCGKGCGHKGSNGAAYGDSYCDKFFKIAA